MILKAPFEGDEEKVDETLELVSIGVRHLVPGVCLIRRLEFDDTIAPFDL
jgi:hypothetical protein